MGDGHNKQIVINPDLHRRLRIHVATLGIPSIKGYVESIIEHAIATTSPPEVEEPELVAAPEMAVEPESEVVAEPEPEPEPEPSEEPMAPALPRVQVVNSTDEW